MHEILRGAATSEERCMAALGLAILANQTKSPEESLGLLLKARDELEQAAGKSANNVQLQAGLAFCYDSLAEMYGRLKEPDLDLRGSTARKRSVCGANSHNRSRRLPIIRPWLRTSSTLRDSKRNEGSAPQALSRLDQIKKTSQQHLDLFVPRESAAAL